MPLLPVKRRTRKIFAGILIFLLLLAPFPDDNFFFIESILAIPLIAVLFLGYHSVITNSMGILQNDAESVPDPDAVV